MFEFPKPLISLKAHIGTWGVQTHRIASSAVAIETACRLFDMSLPHGFDPGGGSHLVMLENIQSEIQAMTKRERRARAKGKAAEVNAWLRGGRPGKSFAPASPSLSTLVALNPGENTVHRSRSHRKLAKGVRKTGPLYTDPKCQCDVPPWVECACSGLMLNAREIDSAIARDRREQLSFGI